MLIRDDIDEAISSQDRDQLRNAFCTLIAGKEEREADIDDPQEYEDLFERLCQALSSDMTQMPDDAVRDLKARLDKGAKLQPGALYFEGVRQAEKIIDTLF